MTADVVAVVDVHAGRDLALRTVRSLRRSEPALTILLAGEPADRNPELEEAGGSWVGGTIAAVANRAAGHDRVDVLLVGGAAIFPIGVLDRARTITAADPRVGSVSFFCDDDGFLGLPRPTGVVDAAPDAADPDATTSALRSTAPDLGSVPIPYASGPAVLVTSSCLSAVGPLADADGRDAMAEMLVDFSLKARRRGFFALADPSTYCRRLPEGAAQDQAAATPTREPEATLLGEYRSPDSPLARVRAATRAKVCGLRVLIDAARLGPQEMGTQVATVALIRALARRADVARVAVALTGDLPEYARGLRDDPKIDARVTVQRDFSAFGQVDVAHRPFQPDSPVDMDACRAVAARTAITVLDLIAYHAVSYQLAPEHWRTYRAWLRQSMAEADGVIVPSHDVRDQIVAERLPVDSERLVVAELGTDHLTGTEPEAAPAALAALGSGFLVVLGADYTHKNRDLAVRAHHELCARGFDLTLVLAGTAVHGSSRPLEEEGARDLATHVVVLPDVASSERNWLLRRAALVLYPTAGEGFGLVPFEAARFGTPTVFVPFGPLAELVGELPVHARDWSPTALADAAERLLADRPLADAQVRTTVAAGDLLTWDATAAKLVVVYRSLLARPAAAPPARPATAAPDGAREELHRLEARHAALREDHDRLQASRAYRLAARAAGVGDTVRDRLPGWAGRRSPDGPRLR